MPVVMALVDESVLLEEPVDAAVVDVMLRVPEDVTLGLPETPKSEPVLAIALPNTPEELDMVESTVRLADGEADPPELIAEVSRAEAPPMPP